MLANLLVNKSVWRVLILYSYGQGIGYNWSELKEYTLLQIKSLQIALEELYFHKILLKEKRIIKLNLANPMTSDLMNIIEFEKKRLNFPNFKLYLALIIMVDKIKKKEIKELYLFGSHAKKTASINSDIDIAVISENLNLNLTKEQIELEEKYGLKFEFHIFKELGKDMLSKEIIEQGVRLV